MMSTKLDDVYKIGDVTCLKENMQLIVAEGKSFTQSEINSVLKHPFERHELVRKYLLKGTVVNDNTQV